jgi:hypothetical protein
MPFLLLTGSELTRECNEFVTNGGILISKPILLDILIGID